MSEPWIPLADVPPGALFLLRDGRAGVVRWHKHLGDGCTVWVEARYESGVQISSGQISSPSTFEARIIDLPALLARLADYERNERWLCNAIHDRREEAGAWLEEGAARARSLCAALAMHEADRCDIAAEPGTLGINYDAYAANCLRGMAGKIKALGPLQQPLLPDVLRVQRDRAVTVLREMVEAKIRGEGDGQRQANIKRWMDAFRAAEALLKEADR